MEFYIFLRDLHNHIFVDQKLSFSKYLHDTLSYNAPFTPSFLHSILPSSLQSALIFSSSDIDCTKGTGYNYQKSKFLLKEVIEIIK